MHEHHARCVNVNSAAHNSAKVSSDSPQIAFRQWLVEYQSLLAIQQGEVNPFTPKAFEQSDNPFLQGEISQLEAGSLHRFAHAFQYHRLGYSETFHEFWIVDYAPKRRLPRGKDPAD
jgi:hypothetical protein